MSSRPVRPALASAACALMLAPSMTVAGVASGGAQQHLVVGDNVLAYAHAGVRPLTEPHLAAHPNDSDHLLGATIVSVAEPDDLWGDRQSCAALLSLDGGRTWSVHDFEVGTCGDPWVGIGPDGSAVATMLATHPDVPAAYGNLLVFHSPDGGRTWNEPPLGLGRAHDHQTVVVDAGGGPRHGSLYVVSGQGLRSADEGKLRWSVFVARSVDGGQRFLHPTSIVPSNLNLNAEVPALLADGELVVSYTDFQRNVDEFRGAGMLERRRTWLLKSGDGGQTFSVPLFITEACGSGWTSLAADTSATEHRDRIYHACKDNAGAIVVHVSADRGETWSDPRPLHSLDDGLVRSTPAVAVNRDGAVLITWLQNIEGAGETCRELYAAASLDGAATFPPPQRVSSATSCPDPTLNGAALGRWPTGGDYYGLTAAADGRFHVLWSDARAGAFALRTATLHVAAR